MMMTTTITEHNEHRCDHRDGIDIGNRNASIHPSRHIKNNITTMATTSRKKNRASPNEKRTRSREASESEPSPKRVKRLAKTMAVAQPPTTKAQEENITNSLGLVVATTIGRPPLPVRQKHQSVAMTNESSEPVCISPVTTNTSTETSTPSRRVSFSNSQVHLIPSRVCDEYRREQQHVFHHHLFSNASKKTPPSFHLSFLLNWVCVCSVLWMGVSAFLHPNKIVAKPNSTLDPVLVADHILPPRHSSQRSNITLREFLVDPAGIDLAMAPSFFGYYGYFGALAAWEDALSNETFQVLSHPNIRSVAGASAGAMAAILLSAGIAPQHAAKFVSTLTLREFADFPGMMAVFKGHKFEDIMRSYLKSQLPPAHSLNLQDGVLPVAVTGFDLQTLRGTLIQRGNMARAARASSCVPFLFQPVGWIDVEDTTTSATAPKNYLFVDGGLDDLAGLKGLAAFPSPRRRVVNMVVGNFLPKDPPPPSQMPFEDVAQVLSISIQNLPQCGPWAMENGPLAVEGAKKAMQEALNLPLYLGNEPGHYELHIDASSFVPRT